MNFEIKGLDYVIAAIGKAKASYPSHNFKLLVVGKGDYKKYSALAQKAGIKMMLSSPVFRKKPREDLSGKRHLYDAFKI